MNRNGGVTRNCLKHNIKIHDIVSESANVIWNSLLTHKMSFHNSLTSHLVLNNRCCVRNRVCNHCHSLSCAPKILCANDRLRNEFRRHCLINDFYFIMTYLHLIRIMPLRGYLDWLLAFGWFLACLCHFNMSRYVVLWSRYCTKMVWYYNEIPGYEILMSSMTF